MEHMLAALELNAPGATLGTDGGSSWPEVARLHKQHHVEDTWHNCENGDERAAVLSNKKNKARFKELKCKVLYQVLSLEKLDSVISEMRVLACDNVALMNWINRIDKGRTLRTATYTAEFFLCSDKASMSRCEQSISRLKGSGEKKSKKENVDARRVAASTCADCQRLRATIMKEIEDAIREKCELSHYVLDWETKERPRADGLEIVT